MSGFEVVPAALQAASTQVDGVGESLQAELNVLTAQVESLLGASWRGAAARGFERGWDEWSDAARSALRALAAMADALRASGSGYTLAEAASVLR